MSDKTLTFCNVLNERNGQASCLTCKNGVVDDQWGDLKCKSKNHITNIVPNGYICKDYKPVMKEGVDIDNT